MSASYAIGSFLGGEWSKTVQGRFDRPDYRTAMSVCLNGFPLEEGAWTRRPGTRHLGSTRSGLPARLYTFDFKQHVPYAIEFSNGHMRFWSGDQLVTDNSSGVISISAATPAVIETGGDLALTGSIDQVVFRLNTAFTSAIGVLPPLLLDRLFTSTRIDATHFSIADGITGVPVDGSTLTPFLPFAVVAYRVQEIHTSYVSGTSSDWANVQIIQAETQGVIVNGGIPQLLTVTSQPTDTAFARFSLTAMDTVLLDGPYLDAGTTLTSTSILTIQGDGSYLITAGVFPDARATGLVAADVGRHVRLYNEPKQWPGSGTGIVGDIVTLYQGSFFSATYWRQLTAAALTTPGTNTADWAVLSAEQAAVWTWGRIATVVSGIRFTLTIAGSALLYGGAGTHFNSWQLGLCSNAVGWPTCGVYHEGRLWLSGVIDNRIDSSMSNNIFTFSPTNFDGNVASNNGISAIFNASDVNAVFWMNSDERGIICGTQGGEWLVSSGSANTPLTPTNIQAHRATKIGCANMEPRRAGNTLVFVQRHQRKIMEYFPDVYSGRLTSPNLTGTAKHLTAAGIEEIAGYQQELAPLLWARMGDGSLKGVTYKRENLSSSQGPNFAGWHRHTLGSGRTVDSICMGSIDGNLDNLMLVTTDNAGSHVEMMTDIFGETDALPDAWFLDDAIVPIVTAVSSTEVTFSGLWHLNGKTVQVFAGGLDCGDRGDGTTGYTDFVVSDGSITVPFADGISAGPGRGLFTQTFLDAGARVIVGFTYNSDGQLVRPMTQADSGARNGPAFAKISRGHRYGMKLVNTLGISVGGDLTQKIYPANFKTAGGASSIAALTLFTGIHQDTLRDDYGYENGAPAWRIARPFPATVVAVGTNLSTQDE